MYRIIRFLKFNKTLIRGALYTDSLSAMQALESENTNNLLIVSLLEGLSGLCLRVDLVFCWLPSHIGVKCNRQAIKATKDASLPKFVPLKVPFNIFKPLSNDFI